MAEYWDCPYFEVSSKTGEGVFESMDKLYDLMEDRTDKGPNGNEIICVLPPPQQSTSSSCTLL